ncbi:hypothetical protein RCL1_008509 [Eukaryota sp. TZLM3-RCL]
MNTSHPHPAPNADLPTKQRSLTLPRTCLRQVLFSGFALHEKPSDLSLLYSTHFSCNRIEQFCKYLSIFGTISRAFVYLLIDAVSDFLTCHELVFVLPTHDSLRHFIMERLPNLKLSVRVLRLHYPRLDCFRIRAIHFSDYGHQPISLFEIQQFLDSTDISPITEFCSGTSFDGSMLDLVLGNLPRLSSLVLNFRLQEDPYSFPKSTRNLRSLTINSISSTLKVGRLTELVFFECESATQIIGLSSLLKLQTLVFNDVKNCDGLHPSARLTHASFSHLTHHVVDVLLQNEQNFEDCEIRIDESQIDNVLPLGIATKVTSLSLCSYELSYLSSRSAMFAFNNANANPVLLQFPNVRDLVLTVFEEITLIPTISFPHLSSLKCCSISDDSVYQILSRSRYVHYLNVDGQRDKSIEGPLPERMYSSITLDYLVCLSVREVPDFFSIISSFAKLQKLSAIRVDFDFDMVNSMFPNLKHLTLSSCQLYGVLTSTNTSVESLEITFHSEDCKKINFSLHLAKFEGVRQVSLHLPLALTCTLLVLPPFTSTLQCYAWLDVIEPAITNLPKLTCVTGTLYCKTKEECARELTFLPSSSRVEVFHLCD